MDITNFKQIEERHKARGEYRTLAVVNATDPTTRGAVAKALATGIVSAIFVGAREQVESDAELQRFADKISVIDASDPDDAAAKAVAEIREGRANVLVKGMLNTDNLLRAILNKETGILPKGNVLTHIAVFEIPTYHKLLMATDVAVIPYPTDAQREAQLRYVVDFAHKLGVDVPRVALIHCSEKVDVRHFPFTADYVTLCEKAKAGDFGHCIVDGPLDVKTACCKAALEKKGMISAVDGEADAVIFPDIEAGNTFYKTLTFFAGASVAGLLCGCAAPVVLPSRGDSVDSKYHSILMAMYTA